MPMDISELKSKKIAELNQIAKELNISGYSDLRKQELIFKILEAQTEQGGLTFSRGVLEVLPDGSFFVTKPEGTGGAVTVRTVKERLLDGVRDPRSYDTPDVVVDLASVRLEPAGRDRVRVWDVRGRPPAAALRVDVAYFDGWAASGVVLVRGPVALEKARVWAGLLRARLGADGATIDAELVGQAACRDERATAADPPEVLLRLCARDPDPARIERFTRLLPAVARSGLPGVVLLGGPPQAREVVTWWPARAPRERAKAILVTRDGERALDGPAAPASAPGPRTLPPVKWPPAPGSRRQQTARLAALAHGCSGDSGGAPSIGVIARAPEVYPWLRRTLTAPVVKRWFAELHPGRVVRRELPNLWALSFHLQGAAGLADAGPPRHDAEGRTLASALLAMEVRVPRALLAAAARGDARDGCAPAAVKAGVAGSGRA